jgi:PAS domain S-box-containing protein
MHDDSSVAPPRFTVLLVDDDPTQLKLGKLHLTHAGFAVEVASGAEEALEKARRRPPSAILSDVLMGDIDGFGLCIRLREDPSLASVPVILLSAHYRGVPDQELAARVGASALVARTPDFDAELAALRRSLHDPAPPTVETGPGVYAEHLRSNANQLQRLVGQARRAEDRYRALFERARDCIAFCTPDGVVLEVNERWRPVLGIDPADLIGKNVNDFSPAGQGATRIADFRRLVAAGEGRTPAIPMQRPDGTLLFMSFSLSVVDVAGEHLVHLIGRDETQSVEAKHALIEAEHKYRSLVERIPETLWTLNDAGAYRFVAPNCERFSGFVAAELTFGGVTLLLDRVHKDDVERVRAAYQALLTDQTLFDIAYRWRKKDETWVWIRDRATAAYDRHGTWHFDGMFSDVTESKQLEEGLRHAQKMEAIGQLTGGIAHDFNNILAAILANSHFLVEDLAPGDPRRDDAIEIKTVAERAAALTKQLLAFSRKQMLEPTVVDLNTTVAGIEKMLRRVIGEDIVMQVLPGKDLGSVRVDVGQLEQVIMNLAVNARDAMPRGGTITIETENVELDEAYASSHASVPPGRYVLLSVSDTGIGMDAAVQARIFEPFFTTKEVGRGTGLGLSTCYGIVKQSGGSIWVYSEPGHGTVFKVYLPRIDDRVDAGARAEKREHKGSETVLLIEDDSHVRGAVRRMLEARGYQLLIARDGVEARALVERHNGPIDLVLTDVVMPGGSGPSIVREMAKTSKRMRALFMSGYTDHAMLRNGALEEGMAFIQKPFSPQALAQKIREVLEVPSTTLLSRAAVS